MQLGTCIWLPPIVTFLVRKVKNYPGVKEHTVLLEQQSFQDPIGSRSVVKCAPVTQWTAKFRGETCRKVLNQTTILPTSNYRKAKVNQFSFGVRTQPERKVPLKRKMVYPFTRGTHVAQLFPKSVFQKRKIRNRSTASVSLRFLTPISKLNSFFPFILDSRTSC